MASRSRNLILPDDTWEYELDLMGPFASEDRLRQHLKSAPAGNPVAEYLQDYLAGTVFSLQPNQSADGGLPTFCLDTELPKQSAA